MPTKPIICVGYAFWDSIFQLDAIPDRPTKVLPRQAVQTGAGMAPAAAATIARFGGTAELWTRVGEDAIGDNYRRDMEHEGVNVAGIRTMPGGRTSFASIFVDRHGERLVVPYVDPTLDPDPSWLPLDRIAGAAAVFADVRWVEGAVAALTRARAVGVPGVLDADIAPVDVLNTLIPYADHVLFSEAALHSVAPGLATADAVRAVVARHKPTVVGVTVGAEGALVWREGMGRDVLHVPSIPIEAVDTLSAGDTWHGAYLFGLASGWDLVRTIRTANVAAAMKCERFGGRLGTPRLAEVEARLAIEAGARHG